MEYIEIYRCNFFTPSIFVKIRSVLTKPVHTERNRRAVMYSPSNGVIANVVLNDLDLDFQGENCEMLISRKWWKPARKCIMSFYRFCYLQSNDKMRRCCARSLWPSFFRSNIFLFWICNENCAWPLLGLPPTRTAPAVALLWFTRSCYN